MPLNQGAVLQWFGVFKHADIMAIRPTHVKVSARWNFIAGPTSSEDFWCKVHVMNSAGKPMFCTVDNDLELTSGHGLKADSPINVEVGEISETLP